MSEIVKRFKKLAFYGVPLSDGKSVSYKRMKGFDTISTAKNPKEYSRQYIDEEFEQTDVVGYTPVISFGFDQFTDNAVHTDIAAIFDGEKTGSDAVRSILIVDLSNDNAAIKRDFAVVAETEGDKTDAYTYSGSFRAKGASSFGTAVTLDDWQTATFVEKQGTGTADIMGDVTNVTDTTE